MDEGSLLERHRVLGVVASFAVLLLVGLVGGEIVGQVLVRLVRLALGMVAGGS